MKTNSFKDKKGKLRAYSEGNCVITGKKYKTADYFYEDYKRWKEGVLIQNALHYLSGDDREFIKTGISPTGWEQIFGDEKD